MKSGIILVRGAGDLGTGIAHALFRAGWRVVALDRPLPSALRLSVAFAAAALHERVEVEGVVASRCATREDVDAAWAAGMVPLWTAAEQGLGVDPAVVVDARMRGIDGAEPPTRIGDAPLTVGIGPGFVAGRDVCLVIESNRGPNLGAVIRQGQAESHTGRPGLVQGYREQRLLIAPRGGSFEGRLEIGDFVEAGDVVGHVSGRPVVAKLGGMIRGLKLSGVEVGAGHKVGDVDPRRDRALLNQMTDKARAIGRGVVRALGCAREARRTCT